MSNLYVETKVPTNVYVDTKKVKSIYLGTEKVWSQLENTNSNDDENKDDIKL